MLKSFPCALLLLMTLSAIAVPLRGGQNPISTLTGDGHREWVYGGNGSWSNGRECRGSDIWVFDSNGSLTKRKCRNRQLVIDDGHNWRVYTNSRGAVVIDIDKATYLLHFKEEEANGLKMTLTLEDGTKSDGFEDLVFHYKPSK